jgi:hypothetical protein
MMQLIKQLFKSNVIPRSNELEMQCLPRKSERQCLSRNRENQCISFDVADNYHKQSKNVTSASCEKVIVEGNALQNPPLVTLNESEPVFSILLPLKLVFKVNIVSNPKLFNVPKIPFNATQIYAELVLFSVCPKEDDTYLVLIKINECLSSEDTCAICLTQVPKCKTIVHGTNVCHQLILISEYLDYPVFLVHVSITMELPVLRKFNLERSTVIKPDRGMLTIAPNSNLQTQGLSFLPINYDAFLMPVSCNNCIFFRDVQISSFCQNSVPVNTQTNFSRQNSYLVKIKICSSQNIHSDVLATEDKNNFFSFKFKLNKYKSKLIFAEDLIHTTPDTLSPLKYKNYHIYLLSINKKAITKYSLLHTVRKRNKYNPDKDKRNIPKLVCW